MPKFPGTSNFYVIILNDMISFEILKSVEICACIDRFLFEFAKYTIYIQSKSLDEYTSIVEFLTDNWSTLLAGFEEE